MTTYLKKCLMLLLFHAQVEATEFIKLDQQAINNSIQVTPHFNIQVSNKVRTAIDNGIVISFVIQAKLYQTVKWWFDTKVESKLQTIQVRYFSLSSQYQLHNINTKSKVSFASLDQLLEYLGSKTTFNFSSGNDGDYLETRVFLDKQALPSIMQLPNVFDADWNINSDWQSIPITIHILPPEAP
ncbi:MAG: DUF4390 domain-containing protein [Marinicella sp.]